MKTTFLKCAIALALPLTFGAAPGFSQDEATKGSTEAVELPEAREIVDRYAKLSGAVSDFENTNSRRAKGTFEMVGMGLAGPMEIVNAKPNKFAITIEMDGMGTMRVGNDGDTAWSIQPMMGAMVQKGAERLQNMLQADYGAALKSKEIYESMKTVAREEFEGKTCWKLEFVARPLEGMDAEKTKRVRTSHEYYDVESGLLLGVKSLAASPMGEFPITTLNQDYEKQGDRWGPRTILQSMGGQKMKMTIEAVSFDDVEDDEFDLPPEIQAQVDKRAEKEKASRADG